MTLEAQAGPCWHIETGLKLEISVGLEAFPFSIHPPCLSPPSLALALQGDRAEMCPELGYSCAAHGAEP